jgi:hypothetical protein
LRLLLYRLSIDEKAARMRRKTRSRSTQSILMNPS